VSLLLVIIGCRTPEQEERPVESLADWCGAESEWPSFAELAYAVNAAECQQRIRCGVEYESRPEFEVLPEDYYECFQIGPKSSGPFFAPLTDGMCIDVCEMEAYVWWFENNCGVGPSIASYEEDEVAPIYVCEEANWPW
jgi:hypothetical protein